MPTPPDQPIRKPRKFSRTLFEAACEAVLKGEDTHPAIERQGISKTQFYRHLEQHPDLSARFQRAQLQRDKVRNAKRIEDAERELHRRGVRGWEEPVFDIKGNLCGYKPRYSDACLIFMLKSLKPEVFAEKPTTLIQNNVLNTKTDSEIVSEWRRRLGAGEGSAESAQ